MNLSGKKLTTAILAGLMGATVAGISVVGAANLVVLNGTTLNVFTPIGTKPIKKPVNVTNGIIDGTTEAGQGNIVSANNTVGQNLTALDTAIAANKNAIQKEISDRQAADDKLKGDMNTKVGIIQGQQDEQDTKIGKNQKDIQTNAGNIQKNGDAIKANSDRLDNHEGRIAGNENNIANNAQNISKEMSARQDADTALQKNIDKEASERNAADSQLNTKMDKGIATIQGQQDEQDAKIGKNQKDIQTNAGNIQKNKDAIKVNSDKLTNHEDRITTNESNIEHNAEAIKNETNARIDADQQEAQTRAAADTRLNTKMDKGFATIQGQQDAQDAKIGKNQKDIQTNAGNIQKNKDAIKVNSDKLTNHEDRITTNESNIEHNAETIKKVQGDVVDEVAARQAADQNLQNQINNNSTSINDLYGRYSSLKTDINKVGAR